MVIFRCKKTCEISTESYVLCSFELEKDPIFRICAIRMDLRVMSYYYLYSLCLNLDPSDKPSWHKMDVKWILNWNWIGIVTSKQNWRIYSLEKQGKISKNMIFQRFFIRFDQKNYRLGSWVSNFLDFLSFLKNRVRLVLPWLFESIL
jgi:hypothetical protein